MKILYKFPSRSRPEKFIKCIENIYINQRHDDYAILASLDADDISMNNPDMIEKMKRYDRLYPIFGVSKNKIHAVNRDMELAPEWDILILMSDDMLFVGNGFDLQIIKDMQDSFPDMDGTLHYPDGNRKDIATMSIMTKKYYDHLGYIYYPGYQTWYADEEHTIIAKKMGKYKFIDKVLFRHNHYQWNGTKPDALYEHNDNLHTIYQDKQLFLSRCGY